MAACAVGLLCAFGLLADDAGASSGYYGGVRFTTKVPGSGGHVICALFQEGGWLEEPVAQAKTPLREKEATCVFQNLKPGAYAIIAFHDADDDGDIDKNFIGIPTEDWCASRDAVAVFGPPSFGAAKFTVGSVWLRLGCNM
jgi:uncharacterized protein (DUF2141 family)